MHHALCHCTDCRRHAGTPMVGWAMFKSDQVSVTWARPRSTLPPKPAGGISARDCGTGLFYTNDVMLPGITDIQSGTLDDPDAPAAAAHIQTADRIAWMQDIRRLCPSSSAFRAAVERRLHVSALRPPRRTARPVALKLCRARGWLTLQTHLEDEHDQQDEAACRSRGNRIAGRHGRRPDPPRRAAARIAPARPTGRRRRPPRRLRRQQTRPTEDAQATTATAAETPTATADSAAPSRRRPAGDKPPTQRRQTQTPPADEPAPAAQAATQANAATQTPPARSSRSGRPGPGGRDRDDAGRCRGGARSDRRRPSRRRPGPGPGRRRWSARSSRPTQPAPWCRPERSGPGCRSPASAQRSGSRHLDDARPARSRGAFATAAAKRRLIARTFTYPGRAGCFPSPARLFLL